MHKPVQPSNICRYCVSFDHWQGTAVFCSQRKQLQADGAGCVFFDRASLSKGDDDGRPRKAGDVP